MTNKKLQKLPTSTELFVLYSNLFSIPNKKIVKLEQRSGKVDTKIIQKRSISDLILYDKLAQKIGVNRNEKTYAELLKYAVPQFELLFEFNELHHKIVQSIFVVGDYKKIPHSKRELLRSLYVEILSILDYFEREVSKLNTCYIFQPKLDSASIQDELVEKFFVPQISACLLYIKDAISGSFDSNDDDYLIIKHFDDVVKFIISYRFNITKAFKKAIILFIEKELKMTKTTTNFSNEFRNIRDDDFPSLARFQNWLNTIAARHKSFDFSIFNKIIAQHKLFHLFIKIKKNMKKKLKFYNFSDLLLDFYYYCNPLILDAGYKIDSSIAGGIL